MANEQLNVVLRHLRRLAAHPSHSQAPDRELLQRFAARGEEAAFEELLRRHGAMVFQVGRRGPSPVRSVPVARRRLPKARVHSMTFGELMASPPLQGMFFGSAPAA